VPSRDDIAHAWVLDSSAEELLEHLTAGSATPGSTIHHAILAALQVRIAERIANVQRETAGNALRWARVSAIAAAVATVISLTALIITVA
jgi:hypothetical protein